MASLGNNELDITDTFGSLTRSYVTSSNEIELVYL